MKKKKKSFFSRLTGKKGDKERDLFKEEGSQKAKRQGKKKVEIEGKGLEEDKNWIEEEEEEGELLVDVYQDGNNIIIRSTVAGIQSEDIDIDINNDMITIRGKRKADVMVDEDDYFYQECYWGSFSRSIILPCEVQANKVKASLKNGVLTIILPKSKKEQAIKVSVNVK